MTPEAAPEAPRRSGSGHDLPRVSRWLAAVLTPVHAVLMRCWYRVEVAGAGRVPASGPFLLAPTHRSRWDAFMLYRAVRRRPPYFMVSHVEMVGVQGWLMRRLGCFPINTRRPGPAAIRSCNELLERGEVLVIFPEGDLYYYGPGEVHPLKQGVAWLALRLQATLGVTDLPIVPVRLVYGGRILRPGSRARIGVGEPIPVKRYADPPAKEGMAALTAALQAALGDTLNQATSAESLAAARRPAIGAQPPS